MHDATWMTAFIGIFAILISSVFAERGTWNANGSYEYYVSKTGVGRSYQQSRSICENEDGRVALVKSIETQEFIQSLVPEGSGKPYGFYIGLQDIDGDGVYVWDDGTKLDFTHWRSGEPNNFKDERCALIGDHNNYHSDLPWVDIHCDKPSSGKMGYICERLIGWNWGSWSPWGQCACPGMRQRNRTCVDTTRRGPRSCNGTEIKSENCSPTGFCNVTLPQVTTTPTPKGRGVWIADAGFEYYVSKNGVTRSFNDSHEFCKGNDAMLAHVLSQEIQSFIQTLVFNETGTPYGFYIGLRYSIAKGKYFWADRTDLDFQKWSSGEPKHENTKFCVSIGNVYKYKDNLPWYSVDCVKTSDGKKGLVCQRKIGKYWNSWSSWSLCNCSISNQTRSRKCVDSGRNGPDSCTGTAIEVQNCPFDSACFPTTAMLITTGGTTTKPTTTNSAVSSIVNVPTESTTTAAVSTSTVPTAASISTTTIIPTSTTTIPTTPVPTTTAVSTTTIPTTTAVSTIPSTVPTTTITIPTTSVPATTAVPTTTTVSTTTVVSTMPTTVPTTTTTSLRTSVPTATAIHTTTASTKIAVSTSSAIPTTDADPTTTTVPSTTAIPNKAAITTTTIPISTEVPTTTLIPTIDETIASTTTTGYTTTTAPTTTSAKSTTVPFTTTFSTITANPTTKTDFTSNAISNATTLSTEEKSTTAISNHYSKITSTGFVNSANGSTAETSPQDESFSIIGPVSGAAAALALLLVVSAVVICKIYHRKRTRHAGDSGVEMDEMGIRKYYLDNYYAEGNEDEIGVDHIKASNWPGNEENDTLPWDESQNVLDKANTASASDDFIYTKGNDPVYSTVNKTRKNKLMSNAVTEADAHVEVNSDLYAVVDRNKGCVASNAITEADAHVEVNGDLYAVVARNKGCVASNAVTEADAHVEVNGDVYAVVNRNKSYGTENV